MQFLNSKTHWGIISILFHWLSAITIIGLFVLGLWMVELNYYDQWYKTAPALHKSFGIVLLIITFSRIIWRSLNISPESLVDKNSKEKKLASQIQLLLYVLLISIMLSGYLISTADGRAIIVFNWFEVPATLQNIEQQEDLAGNIHYWLALSLISLIILHTLASLKHHFVYKDNTLKRILGLNLKSTQQEEL